MTNRPSVLPEWASADVTETVGGVDYPNKSEPPNGLKQSGLIFEQGVAREHFNYQLNLIYDWLNFFDANLTPIGSCFFIEESQAPVSDGGTGGPFVKPASHTADGLAVLGNTTYVVYKRVV